MSDNDFEYVDEDGNPIDPADLGDEYELIEVDEDPVAPAAAPASQPQPQPPTPAPAQPDPVVAPTVASPAPEGGSGGVPKILLVGVAIVVLLLGGGAVFALNSLGNENTVSDVAAGATEVRQSVESEVSEVTRPPIEACSQTGDAAFSSDGETPGKQLRIEEIVPLPAGFVNRVPMSSITHLLQLSRYNWGIYVEDMEDEDFPWWKVSLDTSEGLRMTEAPGDGTDEDASTACPNLEPGAYAVVGEGVPAGAQGMRDGQVEFTLLKPDASQDARVIGVLDDHIAVMTLEYAPEPEDGDAEDAEGSEGDAEGSEDSEAP